MKKKVVKIVVPILISLLVIAGGTFGAAYALIRFGELPVGMNPLLEAKTFAEKIPDTTETIMNQWGNVIIYEPVDPPPTMEELLKQRELEIEEISKEELQTIFKDVDDISLSKYINENQDVLNNGPEKLFIDLVDDTNTPTGIKTQQEDDVLALDAINKIMIAGRTFEHNGTPSHAKIALAYNMNSVNMSLVRNMSYWDEVDVHANENRAILAINASGYNWNDIGSYAILYGAMRYKGETIRKPLNPEDVISFAEDGRMSIGEDIDSTYNAFEFLPTLIKNGEVVYAPKEGEVEGRSAITAIGQKEDGTTIMVVSSGGLYGSEIGATYSDMLQIMQDYGAYNATILSGGSRSIMYWNGRTVNETVGYDRRGVRLPNTIYVSYYTELTEG